MLAAACRAVVVTAALVVLGVWLFWFGQYQWAAPTCKLFRPAVPGGAPAGLILDAACALDPQKPLLLDNLGFYWLAPAAAALACVASLALSEATLQAPRRGPGQRVWATLRSWGATLLPPRHFWLVWCEGLTVNDALLVAAWAAFNAVWFSTILGKALGSVPPSALARPTRLIAKSLASLTAPNLVLLFFPVSRGSVITQVLGLSYTEAIRYHTWLGQWVLCLFTLHGFMYWFSWAQDGRWVSSALKQGRDTNNLLGGVALLFVLLLWATAQAPVRRGAFAVFKTAHHIGFWGFLLAGCAHHWSLFWCFLPGLLLYAVDGVLRLHQALLAGGVDARSSPADAALGAGTATQLLHADVDTDGTMCSLMLAAPSFGVPPAGTVWLNVPSISAVEWHPFDCTAVRVAPARGNGGDRTAIVTHIKAYHRWTKALVARVAEGDRQQLVVRMQGPYPDPYLATAEAMDALVVVAGGNGIAAALSAFQELAATKVNTRGMPALLIWTSRHGHELTFMGPRIMAAARALGLQLTTHLYVTAGQALLTAPPIKPVLAGPPPASAGGRDAPKGSITDSAGAGNNKPAEPRRSLELTVVAGNYASSSGSSSGCGCAGPAGSSFGGAGPAFLPVAQDAGPTSLAAANSMCPVVAFASFAGQLGFRAALHLAVFAGALAGILLTRHAAVVLPVSRGGEPWETKYLGLLLVGLTAGCALAAGLVTLWAGLLVRSWRQGDAAAPAAAVGGGGPKEQGAQAAVMPASATVPFMGLQGRLVPAPTPAGVATAAKAGGVACPLSLLLPGAGAEEAAAYPVAVGRPDTQQLLHGWLNGLQQLPAMGKDSSAAGSSGGGLHCTVFGCGPAPLVHETQLLVHSLNSSTPGMRLEYVRQTWSL